MFKLVQVALVVGNDPRKDWVGCEVVKAPAGILVYLKKEFLIADFVFDPWRHKFTLLEIIELLNDLAVELLVLLHEFKLRKEALFVRNCQ